MVPRFAGGVNRPSLRALRIWSRKRARSSADKYGLRSSTVNFCRAYGGGFVGNGCVDQVVSPGMSDFGTERSSMGQIGSPATRLETPHKPCLVTRAPPST